MSIGVDIPKFGGDKQAEMVGMCLVALVLIGVCGAIIRLNTGDGGNIFQQEELFKEKGDCGLAVIYPACPLKPFFSRGVDMILARASKKPSVLDIFIDFEAKALFAKTKDHHFSLVGTIYKGKHCGVDNPHGVKFRDFDLKDGAKPSRGIFSNIYMEPEMPLGQVPLNIKIRLFEEDKSIYVGLYTCGAEGDKCVAKLRLQDEAIEHRSYYLELYLTEHEYNQSANHFIQVRKVDFEPKSLKLNCSSDFKLPPADPF